jgi:hypothetical protein
MVSFGLDVKINGTEYMACFEAKLLNVSIICLIFFCYDFAYLCRLTSMFRRDLPLLWSDYLHGAATSLIHLNLSV